MYGDQIQTRSAADAVGNARSTAIERDERQSASWLMTLKTELEITESALQRLLTKLSGFVVGVQTTNERDAPSPPPLGQSPFAQELTVIRNRITALREGIEFISASVEA